MKTETTVYISLGILFLVFGLVSALVFLSGGKNKFLISKKLAIGASIIGLTCLSNGCKPFVTCYDVATDPILIAKDSVNEQNIIILQKTDSIIEFNCEFMYYEFVSYRLVREDDYIFTGDCIKEESDSSLNLVVRFPSTCSPGNYFLKLYYLQSTQLDQNSSAFKEFEVKVID